MGTLVLNGKGLLLEGSEPKIEDKQVPGIYTYIYILPCMGGEHYGEHHPYYFPEPETHDEKWCRHGCQP